MHSKSCNNIKHLNKNDCLRQCPLRAHAKEKEEGNHRSLIKGGCRKQSIQRKEMNLSRINRKYRKAMKRAFRITTILLIACMAVTMQYQAELKNRMSELETRQNDMLNQMMEHRIETEPVAEKPAEEPAETEEVKATVESLGEFRITYYCPCSKCCGKSDGITRMGTKATEGRTIGVDPEVIPLGSTVYIDGQPYVAEDTGYKKGKIIDVFVEDHQRALELGVRKAEVFI